MAVVSFKHFDNVIIPVMWPGVITAGLFSFLLAYNDFAVTADTAKLKKTKLWFLKLPALWALLKQKVILCLRLQQLFPP